MDADMFLFLFNFFLFVGVIIAFKDRTRINDLVRKVGHLERMLDFQEKQVEKLKRKVKELSHPESAQGIVERQPPTEHALEQVEEKPEAEQVLQQASSETEVVASPLTLETSAPLDVLSSADKAVAKSATGSTAETVSAPQEQVPFTFEDLLKGNGIFWLGALVLAIGGIFLAKYSIESGLLPPSVRVILGSVFGIALVVSAEVVNQYKAKLKVNTPYISAALASGGVITCFAMALVSFNFYDFISPNVAFVLLALISLVATWLALRFGPLLAAIGIIGSYAVPILVSSDSKNVMALLLYVSFVSLSAVWVAEYVKQKWLWWLSFVWHFSWFASAAAMAGKGDVAILIVFAIVSLYLYVLAGLLGWKLNQTMTQALPVKSLLMPRKEQGTIVLTLLFTAVYLALNNEFTHIVWVCLSLSAVVMWVSYRHSALDSWPFWMLAFGLFAFALMPEISDFDDNLFPFSGKYLFIQLAILMAMTFSLFMALVYNRRHAYLLLLVLAPISLYGISYIRSETAAEAILYPIWAIEMLIIAGVASFGAMKTRDNTQQVTFLVLANAMLTLSFTMLLSASTLTLALAIQVASMSYLSWKYKVCIPDWIYKLALLVVVTRLTFAPWLADYKDEAIFNVHWTLIVYPAVLAVIWFATKYNPSKPLNVWFMGVFIHVVALLVTTETSYFLIGDYPNLFDLSYQEGVLLALNWITLAAVYFWRSRLTQSMTRLYQIGGMLLLAGTTLIHLDVSLFSSPFFKPHFVGEGLLNWTILQWLLPSIVLYLFTRFKLVDEKFTPAFYGGMGVFSFLFINAEIRNLFNDGYLVLKTPLQQAELYSYSIVWLLISTITIFAAQHFNHKQLRNMGFAGLALVILKAFGVDMSHLEGLWRALSFIGLGLCLVGIGWLFQKMQLKTE